MNTDLVSTAHGVPKIRVDRDGAEWAHSMGFGTRTAYPYEAKTMAMKRCPFADTTPHAVWWLRGWYRSPFDWPSS